MAGGGGFALFCYLKKSILDLLICSLRPSLCSKMFNCLQAPNGELMKLVVLKCQSKHNYRRMCYSDCNLQLLSNLTCRYQSPSSVQDAEQSSSPDCVCSTGTHKIDRRLALTLMYTFQRQYHPFVLLKMPQEKLGHLLKCWRYLLMTTTIPAKDKLSVIICSYSTYRTHFLTHAGCSQA